MPDPEWWWVVSLAPLASAGMRWSLVVFLALISLFSRDPERKQTAERLLGKLPVLLPWHRNNDEPPQLGQGASS